MFRIHSPAERFGFHSHSPVALPCFAGQLNDAGIFSAATSLCAARAPHAAASPSKPAWPTTTARRRTAAFGDLSRRDSALRHTSNPSSLSSALPDLAVRALSCGSSADLSPLPRPAVAADADPRPVAARLMTADPHAGELTITSTTAEPVHLSDILAHSLLTPAPPTPARRRVDAPCGVRMFSSPAPPPAADDQSPAPMRARRDARSLHLLSGTLRLGTGRHASCAGDAATVPTPARRGSHALLPFARTLESLAAQLDGGETERTHADGHTLEGLPSPTLCDPASSQTWPRPRAASLDASFSTAGASRSRPEPADGRPHGSRAPLPEPILFASLKPPAATQAPPPLLLAPLTRSTGVTVQDGGQLGGRLSRRAPSGMRHLPRLAEDESDEMLAVGGIADGMTRPLRRRSR